MVVFFNRRRQHCRILFWDRNGFVMIAKRLEKGTFRVPWEAGETQQPWSLEAAELHLILEGANGMPVGLACAAVDQTVDRGAIVSTADLRGARKRPRWQPPTAAMDDTEKNTLKA